MKAAHVDHPPVLALCGKGGVGKTSLAALIVKTLAADPKARVLAIDADPAVGLATALGVSVSRTVDEVRNALIRRVKAGLETDRGRMLAMLDDEMFSTISENKNIAFIAIGRPEAEGCYCQVNHMLKDIIAAMARNFDFVVIDGEAGVEQVNRRVMERVSHLILVSDASRKGLQVAETILKVSKTAIGCERAGLIVNRTRDREEYDRLAIPESLVPLGWIPEDDRVRTRDIEGKSLLDMAESPALHALRNCLAELGVPAA